MLHCCVVVVVVFGLKKISCFGQEPEELTAGGGEIPGGISRGCRDPRSPQGLLIMLLLLLSVVVVYLLISQWLLFLLILRRNVVISNRPLVVAIVVNIFVDVTLLTVSHEGENFERIVN